MDLSYYKGGGTAYYAVQVTEENVHEFDGVPFIAKDEVPEGLPPEYYGERVLFYVMSTSSEAGVVPVFMGNWVAIKEDQDVDVFADEFWKMAFKKSTPPETEPVTDVAQAIEELVESSSDSEDSDESVAIVYSQGVPTRVKGYYESEVVENVLYLTDKAGKLLAIFRVWDHVVIGRA